MDAMLAALRSLCGGAAVVIEIDHVAFGTRCRRSGV
jgi:hypothetical protein